MKSYERLVPSSKLYRHISRCIETHDKEVAKLHEKLFAIGGENTTRDADPEAIPGLSDFAVDIRHVTVLARLDGSYDVITVEPRDEPRTEPLRGAFRAERQEDGTMVIIEVDENEIFGKRPIHIQPWGGWGFIDADVHYALDCIGFYEANLQLLHGGLSRLPEPGHNELVVNTNAAISLRITDCTDDTAVEWGVRCYLGQIDRRVSAAETTHRVFHYQNHWADIGGVGEFGPVLFISRLASAQVLFTEECAA